NETGIEAVDMRGKWLRAERAEHRLEHGSERGKPDHRLGMAGLQQEFHHVEDQQRPHAVIGEALPHLGREQEGEPAWMAEKIAALGAIGSLGNAHEVRSRGWPLSGKWRRDRRTRLAHASNRGVRQQPLLSHRNASAARFELRAMREMPR